MTNKAYMKPITKVMKIQPHQMICDSVGMNMQLQGSTVNSAWSRSNDGWDEDED